MVENERKKKSVVETQATEQIKTDAPNIETLTKEKTNESENVKEVSEANIHLNPEYEALVARPSKDEEEAIRLDIEKEGQLEKIIVNQNGTILDGHTRYKILKALHKPVDFDVQTFKNADAEHRFIISRAKRRNLTVFEKVKLAQDRLKEERAKAEKRKKSGNQHALGPDEPKGDAIGIVAREFGIPRTTFRRMQYILDHAGPGQIKGLGDKSITASQLYQKLKRKNESERKPKESEGAANQEMNKLTSCDGCQRLTPKKKRSE